MYFNANEKNSWNKKKQWTKNWKLIVLKIEGCDHPNKSNTSLIDKTCLEKCPFQTF